MKALLLLTGAALAALSICSAAPTVPCVSGLYASYQALTMGCSVNGQQFSGVQILPAVAGSTAILPGLIAVSPITMVFGPGLLFTLNASASNGQSLVARLGFNVNPLALGNRIGDSTLAQKGGTAALDGGVTGIETICLGSALAANGTCATSLATSNPGTFALDGIPPQSTDSVSFAAQTLIGITGDFSAFAGTAGTAAVTSFGIQVNAIPEPGTLALLCPAGIGLWLWCRKKTIQTGGF